MAFGAPGRHGCGPPISGHRPRGGREGTWKGREKGDSEVEEEYVHRVKTLRAGLERRGEEVDRSEVRPNPQRCKHCAREIVKIDPASANPTRGGRFLGSMYSFQLSLRG